MAPAMSTATCFGGVASGLGLAASAAFWPEKLDSYDFVLKFDSLTSFLEKGKIDIRRTDGSTFPLEAVAEDCRVIAVAGLFDKGKTFILNKLFGLNLPSGKLCTTKGLSFYYVAERRILLVDTAGAQAPVSYRGQDQGVQPISDAMTTEEIILELIAQLAHQLVFVVSDLTWSEQKYITTLCEKNKRHGTKSKAVLVIHNMRTTWNKSEATKLFTKQVEQIYCGVPSHLGKLQYSAKRGDNVVEHIGICQHGSAAGRAFNKESLGKVLSMLEVRDTVGLPVQIGEQLAQEFQRLLPRFAKRDAPDGSDAAAERLEVDFDPLYASGPALVLRPGTSKPIMRKKGVVTQLGDIISYDTSFQPCCNFFELKDPRDDGAIFRIIEVECPGATEDDLDIQGTDMTVEVEIKKVRTIDERTVNAIDPIQQTQGTWRRSFPLEGGRDISWNLHNGVLKIEICRPNSQYSVPVRRVIPAEVPAIAAESPVVADAAAAASVPRLDYGSAAAMASTDLVCLGSPLAVGSAAAGDAAEDMADAAAGPSPTTDADDGAASAMWNPWPQADADIAEAPSPTTEIAVVAASVVAGPGAAASADAVMTGIVASSPRTEASADRIGFGSETERSADGEYNVVHMDAASTPSSRP